MITSTWEEQPPDRARRRFYTLTEDGRSAWNQEHSKRTPPSAFTREPQQ